MIDRVRRLISPSGLFLVLIGPDGVGKSTVAGLTTSLLQSSHLAKHMHLGFRPQILPTKLALQFWKENTEALASNQPTAKMAETPSVIRLIYYTLDYLLGYYLKIWPVLRRGGFFVGERYFYDYLVILPRKVAGAPPWLVRMVFPLIPKPDVLVFLHDDPKVIHKRKHELEYEEIERQLKAFDIIGKKAKAEFVKIRTDRPVQEISLQIATLCRNLINL